MANNSAPNNSPKRLTDDDFDRLAEEYLSECEHNIQDLEVQIMNTLSSKDINEGLRILTRTVHSIKGASGSYGFDLISSICHNFEDRLLAIHYSEGQVDAHIDGMLRYVDLLMDACRSYINKDKAQLAKISSELKGQFSPPTPTSKGAPEAHPQGTGNAKRKRVLVIERLRSIQVVVNKLLAAYDSSQVEVSNAHDGYEGLGRLLKEKYDLVIMSNMSEWIPGEHLLKVLSEVSNPNNKVPFILLTSSENKSLPATTNPVHMVVKAEKFTEKVQQAMVTILGSPQAAKQEVPGFAYKKILLIDDSKDIHMLVGLAFKKESGVAVKSAYSGKEGVDSVSSFKPDLILIDYNMPEMDGVETAKLIRARAPKTPIIFLTGASRESEKSRLEAEKPLGIIKKPFPPRSLVESISQLSKS